MSLQPGTVIAGRYEVVKCLGAGSMGLVYACRHRELTGHLVAVKVLFPEVAQDKVAAARFRNEIFASYGVSHPNVVRAYEYLRDGELVAYTMEYVGGGALADKLDSGVPIPVSEVIRLIAQMCAGVQAIHDAGIIHRDLKPENILLTKDGVVKIADFGIARTGHGPKLTEHGGVVGTIDYVSPEYMLNSQVDHRSDIYALGILAYEMLTGDSPFRGDSVYATMTKRLKTDPKAPSSLRPDCPAELDSIVLKAMAREPENRYQSAAEILYDLQKLVPDQRLTSGSYLQLGYRGAAKGLSPEFEDREEEININKLAGEEPISGTSGRFRQDKSSRIVPKLDEKRDKDARAKAWPGGETREVSTNTARTGEFSSDTGVSSPAVEGDELASSAGGPAPMDKILSHRGAINVEPRGGEISVGRAGIDNNRIRRLSQMADQASPSLWADLLILLVAAVIGVGVGLIFLNFFFPDILKEGLKLSS